MLRISRRPGESIRIGPDIVITVLGPRKGETEIGVVAPRGVKILRGELVTPPAPPPAQPTGDAK